MRTHRNWKFRLYPSKEQQKALTGLFDSHRKFYNAALEQRQIAWKSKAIVPLYALLKRDQDPIALKKHRIENKLESIFSYIQSNMIPSVRKNYSKNLEKALQVERGKRDPWQVKLVAHALGKDLPKPTRVKHRGLSVSYTGNTKNGTHPQYADIPFVKDQVPEFNGFMVNPLRETLRRLEKGYNAFFARGGFPKYKSASEFTSVCASDSGIRLKEVETGSTKQVKLFLTDLQRKGVYPYVKVLWHREIPSTAKITSRIVSRNPQGHWYLSLLLEMEIAEPNPAQHLKPEVALEFGLQQITLSDGNILNLARNYEKLELQRKVLSACMSRRRPLPGKPASKGYLKAKLAKAKLEEKMSNCRKDFNHKLSRYLVTEYGHVIVSGINLSTLVKGKNIRFGDVTILDSGIGMLRLFLKYKGEETGTYVSEVDPAKTEILCSECGCVVAPQKGKVVICEECGYSNDKKKGSALALLRKARVSPRLHSDEELKTKPKELVHA